MKTIEAGTPPESKEWKLADAWCRQPGLWSKEVKTQLILDAKIDCSNISTLAFILWAWI